MLVQDLPHPGADGVDTAPDLGDHPAGNQPGVDQLLGPLYRWVLRDHRLQALRRQLPLFQLPLELGGGERLLPGFKLNALGLGGGVIFLLTTKLLQYKYHIYNLFP